MWKLSDSIERMVIIQIFITVYYISLSKRSYFMQNFIINCLLIFHIDQAFLDNSVSYNCGSAFNKFKLLLRDFFFLDCENIFNDFSKKNKINIDVMKEIIAQSMNPLST